MGTQADHTALYLDGKSARVRSVTVTFTDGARPDDRALMLREGDTILARWPLRDIRTVPGQVDANALVVTQTEMASARLTLKDPALIAQIKSSAPKSQPEASFERGPEARGYLGHCSCNRCQPHCFRDYSRNVGQAGGDDSG